MQRSLASIGPALGALGLLVAVGALAVCKTTPGCYLGARSGQETLAPIHKGEDVSTQQTPPLVRHVDEADFPDVVLKSDVPVLVDFYADWCGPCQRLAPVLEDLAAELPDVRIVKVNVDQNLNLASQFRINAIPSLKVFKNGAVVDQVTGLASKSQLRSMLDR